MPVRWGLLGCGDIAKKRVAEAIISDPRCELVAACRRDSDRLEAFGKEYGVPFITTSADELIRRPDVDAVYIATPVHQHCEQTIAAAGQGKHVLVEKPMALRPEECERMISACSDANVKLGVAYYRRFYPVVLRMAELISSGTLGRPLSILATTGNPIRFPADDWRVVKSLGGGGPLMDIGSHRLDLFLQLLGDVDSVQADCGCSPDYEAEEMATLLMKFTNGAHGVLQCYFGTQDTPDRLEVIGTDGRVTTEDLNSGELTVVTSAGVKVESHLPNPNFHAPLISDFADALLSDKSPAVTGEIGMATNRLIENAYR